MQGMLIKLFVGMAMQLLTERFVARTIVRGCRALAEKTTNDLDDGMVDDLADALGQEDMKKANHTLAK